MENEKGITLVTLIITVMLMIILALVTINIGTDSLQTTRLQNFSYVMQQIQGKVDTIYEKIKLGNKENIILGRDVTESSGAMNTLKKIKEIDYSSISDSERENYYYEDTYTYYRYFTSEDLEEYLDITNSGEDVIINFMTREVISIDGCEYKGTVYHRLSDI